MDAAWNNRKAFISRVAMDHGGVAKLLWIYGIKTHSPLASKAHAILHAPNVALDTEWNRIWIQSDALLLLESISNPSSSPGEVRNLIID